MFRTLHFPLHEFLNLLRPSVLCSPPEYFMILWNYNPSFYSIKKKFQYFTSKITARSPQGQKTIIFVVETNPNRSYDFFFFNKPELNKIILKIFFTKRRLLKNVIFKKKKFISSYVDGTGLVWQPSSLVVLFPGKKYTF